MPQNKAGENDIGVIDNLPGLEALRTADLMVLFMRMMELPDAQVREIIDYTDSGRPIVGLRTSTHPFNYAKRKDSPYAKWTFTSADPSYASTVVIVG